MSPWEAEYCLACVYTASGISLNQGYLPRVSVLIPFVLVITQARVPYGTRAWVITNLLHDVEDHHFQGLMY